MEIGSRLNKEEELSTRNLMFMMAAALMIDMIKLMADLEFSKKEQISIGMFFILIFYIFNFIFLI